MAKKRKPKLDAHGYLIKTTSHRRGGEGLTAKSSNFPTRPGKSSEKGSKNFERMIASTKGKRHLGELQTRVPYNIELELRPKDAPPGPYPHDPDAKLIIVRSPEAFVSNKFKLDHLPGCHKLSEIAGPSGQIEFCVYHKEPMTGKRRARATMELAYRDALAWRKKTGQSVDLDYLNKLGVKSDIPANLKEAETWRAKKVVDESRDVVAKEGSGGGERFTWGKEEKEE